MIMPSLSSTCHLPPCLRVGGRPWDGHGGDAAVGAVCGAWGSSHDEPVRIRKVDWSRRGEGSLRSSWSAATASFAVCSFRSDGAEAEEPKCWVSWCVKKSGGGSKPSCPFRRYTPPVLTSSTDLTGIKSAVRRASTGPTTGRQAFPQAVRRSLRQGGTLFTKTASPACSLSALRKRRRAKVCGISGNFDRTLCRDCFRGVVPPPCSSCCCCCCCCCCWERGCKPLFETALLATLRGDASERASAAPSIQESSVSADALRLALRDDSSGVPGALGSLLGIFSCETFSALSW
mmetsp:Transcript_103823/g.289196  ORF Transcript_103823/g.289196 Transcript_103823/m.289196 type:complete len:290 (-) Transcript_103823:1287-2156(-)